MKKKKIKKARNGFTSDPTFPTKDPNPFYGVPPFVQEEISTKDQNPFYGTSPVEIMERMDIGKLQKIKPKSLINTPEIKPLDLSIPPKEDKQKTDWSNILAAGLQGINGLIPRGDIKRQYLRPEDQLTYNQNPYGTESQAIMKKGGKVPKYTGGGKKKPTEYKERTFWDTATQFLPGYEQYLDVKDVVIGAATGNKTQMNQGVIGMAIPFAGKAITGTLDYMTEKMAGKKVADANQGKREGILEMSTRDLQKLYTKYGAGGYDKWAAAGYPTLEKGGKITKYPDGGKKAYNPNLAKADSNFTQWYNQNTIEGKNNIPFSDSLDYDYYSFYRNGDYKNYKGGHFPDTYKRTNHETFSNESIYSVPENTGGHWKGEEFIPANKSPYIMKDGGKKKAEAGMFMPVGDDEPKRKRKLKGGDNVVPMGYDKYSGINNGSESPTEEEWILNMVEYMKTNNPETSNVYRPEYSHHSINYNPEVFEPTIAKNGAKIKMNYGGLQTHSGGSAPQVSHNPFDGGMGEFKGNSHENGGIKASFSGKPFEAEGGEPYRIAPNGDLEIFGALRNPVTGNTFKKDGKMLAKKEQKAAKYTTLGTELVNNSPEQKDKFELLKFNSGQAMLRGGLGEQKKLAKEKENLSMMQRIMLQEESPEKAEHGGYYAKGGVVDPEKELKEQKEYYQNILKNPKKHYEWEVAQAKEFIKNPSSFYEGLIEYNNNQIKQGNKDSYLKDEINDYKEVLNYLKNPNKNKAKIKKVETPLQNSTNTQSTNLPKENTVSQELTPISPVGTPDPREKFESLKSKTQAALEAKYPGKKIEIKYNDIGKERSNKQQSGIKSSQKQKLSQDWSTHNWDAGRDYNIYIDGKLQPKTSPAYKTLHTLAKEDGLFPLRGNAGKNDPFHISLVQEGGPNTAKDLLAAYPEIANFEATKNWAKELKGNKKLSDNLAKAYTALNPKFDDNEAAVDPMELVVPKTHQIDGEGLYPKQNFWNPEQYMFNTPKQNPPAPPAQQETQPFNFTNPKPQTTPAIPTRFPWEQTLPVLPALFDQPDPVQMQQYTPDLYEDYEVSFQDRRNRNIAQLRGVAQAAGYDPSALGTFGAQAFQVDNEVDAEEFRVNQGITNDVVNKNTGLLNDAELKNLGIIDQQYVRQTQAIGNTRDRRSDALIQLGDLVAQNSLENKTLNVYHNLYKDYTFDENGQLQYVGPNSKERTDAMPYGTPTQTTKSVTTTKTGNTTVQNTQEPLIDWRPAIKKSLKRGAFEKNGGVVTQSKLAKLMNS